MRDDHKLALKKIKQQINAFCLRHGHYYTQSKWTIAHWKWLKKLELNAMYPEVLNEYMTSHEEQVAKIERFDERIDELATQERYAEKVKKLTRLRSCYYKFIRHGKARNIAVAAVARELACFIWGMMTDNVSVKLA